MLTSHTPECAVKNEGSHCTCGYAIDRSRLAILTINPELLYKLLKLPPEYEFCGGTMDWETNQIKIKLRHESFPPTEDGYYLPIWRPLYELLEDGTVKVNLDYPPKQNDG